MKKYFVLLLSVILMLLQLSGANAQIGDVITYTKHTDIYAYINNYIIPSYNIEGFTGIVAEDLRYYGFDVVWNEEERTLNIWRSSTVTEINTYLAPEEAAPSRLGKNAYAVLETDIKTFINGEEGKSYNIGGKTVIIFDALAIYGEVKWDDISRKIKLWINDGLDVSDYETQPLPISTITLYSADGRTLEVAEDDVNAYLNVGWYKTYEEAISSNSKISSESSGYESGNNQPNSGGSAVYRTPKGKRYHFDPDCGGKNSYRTTLSKAKGAGLTPCKKCAY